jgi:hypothetical protein
VRCEKKIEWFDGGVRVQIDGIIGRGGFGRGSGEGRWWDISKRRKWEGDSGTWEMGTKTVS